MLSSYDVQIFVFYYNHQFKCINNSDLYSEVPLIRPPMVLVENSLNGEQVSLMRHIFIGKCF